MQWLNFLSSVRQWWSQKTHLANDEDVGEPGSEAVAWAILDVHHVEGARVTLPVGDHTNTPQVSTTSHHAQVTWREQRVINTGHKTFLNKTHEKCITVSETYQYQTWRNLWSCHFPDQCGLCHWPWWGDQDSEWYGRRGSPGGGFPWCQWWFSSPCTTCTADKDESWVKTKHLICQSQMGRTLKLSRQSFILVSSSFNAIFRSDSITVEDLNQI